MIMYFIERVSFKPLLLKLLCWVLFSTYASASPTSNIRFGIIGFAPWGMKENHKVTGVFWDQAKAILNEVQLQGSPAYAAYPRIIKQLKEGHVDCSIFTKNILNDKYYHFVSYLYDLNVTVISRKGLIINSYDDFFDDENIKVVGFPNGGENFFPTLFADPFVKKQILPSQEQGPAMIQRGRIDAFIGIEKTLIYEVDKQGLKGSISFTGYNVSALPVWLQCSKKSSLTQQDLDTLKHAVEKLKSQNAFQKIIQLWLPLSIEDMH
jgi:ABC-type amino acid transport substrate-binding protein